MPEKGSSARPALERIYLALGGDLDTLATGKLTKLTGDFIHEPSGTLIEVDESQHFTSFRLRWSDERSSGPTAT